MIAARWRRWCGICLAWCEEIDGHCETCGNAHMTGDAIPIPMIEQDEEE